MSFTYWVSLIHSSKFLGCRLITSALNSSDNPVTKASIKTLSAIFLVHEQSNSKKFQVISYESSCWIQINLAPKLSSPLVGSGRTSFASNLPMIRPSSNYCSIETSWLHFARSSPLLPLSFHCPLNHLCWKWFRLKKCFARYTHNFGFTPLKIDISNILYLFFPSHFIFFFVHFPFHLRPFPFLL